MPSTLQLRANDTILFIGDSITAAERHRQVCGPLGFGYVHFAGNFLLARYPQLDLKIVNTGVSGDTLHDMKQRWEKDCLAHRPNVVSVLVGVNDAWQLTMEPQHAPSASTPHEYEVTFGQLLALTRRRCNCRLVLMEPFMFCRDPENEVFRALTPYVAAVRRLAARYEATLVPLQSEIDRLLDVVPPEKWSADTVHPYLWAHAWIAQRWLEATGL
jgi:lysophospholipase L1-like esterase